jgi:hypothetical protein
VEGALGYPVDDDMPVKLEKRKLPSEIPAIERGPTGN